MDGFSPLYCSVSLRNDWVLHPADIEGAWHQNITPKIGLHFSGLAHNDEIEHHEHEWPDQFTPEGLGSVAIERIRVKICIDSPISYIMCWIPITPPMSAPANWVMIYTAQFMKVTLDPRVNSNANVMTMLPWPPLSWPQMTKVRNMPSEM